MIATARPNRSLEWLRPPPGPVLLAVMLAHHFGLWWRESVDRGIGWTELLDHGDPAGAFFPLYPMLVRSLVAVSGALLSPPIAGTLLSTALLTVFVFACRPAGLVRFVTTRPVTPWGMALILYAPASFILHCHHAEALFLLLSFFALQSAQRGDVVIATGCAALALWVLPQGVLVCATVLALLFVCVRQQKLPLRAVGVCAAAIAVSGLALLWLAGAPSLLPRPHDVLHLPDSVSPARVVWFFGTLALCVWFTRRHVVLGSYALISMALMFLQGEFANTFRASVVLFPLWFWLGQRLERSPLALRYALTAALLALNHVTAHRYALAQWSY